MSSAAQKHEEALYALEVIEAAYSTGCQQDLDATPDALLKLRRYLEETKP